MILTLDYTPPIARIQLNAPETLNALTLHMGKSFQQALADIENNNEIKVVIINSLVQKAFSVGIDLKEFHTHNSNSFRVEFLNAWNSINSFKKPIIAAINGYAMGGGLELALKADIIIASDDTTFAQPELKVGTIPGLGATQYLPRKLSYTNAAHMILTGESFNAEKAQQLGLISQVTLPKDLHATATKIAKQLCKQSLPLLIAAKAQIKKSFEVALSVGLESEKESFLNTFTLEDQTEGFEAFLNKREPHFQNK